MEAETGVRTRTVTQTRFPIGGDGHAMLAHIEAMERAGYSRFPYSEREEEDWIFTWAKDGAEVLDSALVHLDEEQRAGQLDYDTSNKAFQILATARDLCLMADPGSIFWRRRAVRA